MLASNGHLDKTDPLSTESVVAEARTAFETTNLLKPKSRSKEHLTKRVSSFEKGAELFVF